MVRRRRKKSTRSKSGDGSCDLDVDGGKQVEYRCFGIPGVYIHGRNPRIWQWFAVKPSPIYSWTRIQI